MGKITGFKEYPRKKRPEKKPLTRIENFHEFTQPMDEHFISSQAARCMDCGVPFCQSSSGCPVDNLIPEWNDLAYRGQWKEALDRLHKTNNFPEFTGRICPAPCESACVLGINEKPVSIKAIEQAIIDYALEHNPLHPQPPTIETKKKVAIIGSGPAGLTAAQQLRRVGHSVTVFEREDRIGGLLVYGIPNMKLDKSIVEKRVDQIREEGVCFTTNTEVGTDISIDEIQNHYDAILLAIGATKPRDVDIEGRSLSGIEPAMKLLTENTRALLTNVQTDDYIDCKGKKVAVIGGGDTGTDCIATAIRQGCSSLVNFELMKRPPNEPAPDNPWPQWPHIYRIDYGHEEAQAVWGKDPRKFAMMTKRFIGDQRVHAIESVEVEWAQHSNGLTIQEIPKSKKIWEVDLVFLAMGFVGPEPLLPKELGLTLDESSNIAAHYGTYATNMEGVFTCGDCRRGQSLVVWAIAEGRGAARAIDEFLMKESDLLTPD